MNSPTAFWNSHFGMRFGPVRDFLREKVAAIVDEPYRCDHLRDLNESAVQTLARLDEPMPPFVNNFRGVRVSLSEIMMNQASITENARGHLAVHVEKPEMFIGMAQMFLPDLSALEITPGDPPVRLPESLVPTPGITAYAAMSTDAIGLAVGEGEEAGLPEFLDRDAGPGRYFPFRQPMTCLPISTTPRSWAGTTRASTMTRATSTIHIQRRPWKYRLLQAPRSGKWLTGATRPFVSHLTGLVVDNRMTFK